MSAPFLQHAAIFGDLVLALLGRHQIVGVDIFEPDENPPHPGRRRLLDEVRRLVAHGVDLDDDVERKVVGALERDHPVEQNLPVLVAGEIVIGDEEGMDALGMVIHDDPLEIIGRPEPALAALHVDDGAEGALERAAAAEIEARKYRTHLGGGIARQKRCRLAFEAGQVVHEIVERRQPATEGVGQHLIEPPALRLAGKQRDAGALRLGDFGRERRKHGEAARHVKAADGDRNACLGDWTRQVHRPRELVRLHADDCHQTTAAGALDFGNDPIRPDAGVGLVQRLDDDLGVFAEDLAAPGIVGEPVHRRQRVRGNVGAQPSNRIAVIVVMRWLDENHAEHRICSHLDRPRHENCPRPI